MLIFLVHIPQSTNCPVLSVPRNSHRMPCLPVESGHKLERTVRFIIARNPGDANDNGRTPRPGGSTRGLTHQVHVATTHYPPSVPVGDRTHWKARHSAAFARPKPKYEQLRVDW